MDAPAQEREKRQRSPHAATDPEGDGTQLAKEARVEAPPPAEPTAGPDATEPSVPAEDPIPMDPPQGRTDAPPVTGTATENVVEATASDNAAPELVPDTSVPADPEHNGPEVPDRHEDVGDSHAEAQLSTIEALAEPVADDLSAPPQAQGAASVDGLFDDDAAAAQVVPPASEPVVDTSKLGTDIHLLDMFGDFGNELEPTQQPKEDPVYKDSLQTIVTAFGDVDEADFGNLLDPMSGDRHLQHQQLLAQHEASIGEAVDVFGRAGLDHLQSVHPSTYGNAVRTLKCVKPTVPISSATGPVVHLTLPTLYPSRQALHVDAQPYSATAFEPPVSSPYEVHTPTNTIRWARTSKKHLSNARIVAWSDGSKTLHIGNDAYDIQQSTLPHTSIITAGSSVDTGVSQTDAEVEALQVRGRFIVSASTNKPNSVQDYISAVDIRNRSVDVSTKVGMSAEAMPQVGKHGLDVHPYAQGSGDEGRQFLETQRRAREARILQLQKAGRGMPLCEQLEDETRTLQVLLDSGYHNDSGASSARHSTAHLVDIPLDEAPRAPDDRIERVLTDIAANTTDANVLLEVNALKESVKNFGFDAEFVKRKLDSMNIPCSL